jgi:DNA polymerase III delta subunit
MDESNLPRWARDELDELRVSVSSLEELVSYLGSNLSAQNREIERLKSLNVKLRAACRAALIEMEQLDSGYGCWFDAVPALRTALTEAEGVSSDAR